MQGRSQFEGRAPSNMDFPVEAYVAAHGQAYHDVGQAYAKAAQIESEAKQKMVGDLAQGALSGFGAYKEGLKAEKNFAAGRAALDSDYFKKMLNLSDADASAFGSYLDQVKNDQGVEVANKMMDNQLSGIMQYAKMAKQHTYDIELQQERNKGTLGAAGIRAGGSGGGSSGFSLVDSTK